MNCNICKMEENPAPGLPFLFSVLMFDLVGRVHHAQDNILKLTLSQWPPLPLTLQCAHHLHHGAPTSGNVVIDLRQESPALPHRCYLLVDQDGIVILVHLQSTQQNLYEGEKRKYPSLSAAQYFACM